MKFHTYHVALKIIISPTFYHRSAFYTNLADAIKILRSLERTRKKNLTIDALLEVSKTKPGKRKGKREREKSPTIKRGNYTTRGWDVARGREKWLPRRRGFSRRLASRVAYELAANRPSAPPKCRRRQSRWIRISGDAFSFVNSQFIRRKLWQ